MADGDFDDFDDCDGEYDPCDHEGHDVDVLTGRGHCWRCGEAWWLTGDQLRHELELNAKLCEAIDDDLGSAALRGSDV